MKNLAKRIITGLTIGVIAIGGYGAAFASSDDASAPADKAAIAASGEFRGPGGHGGGPGRDGERPDMVGNLVTEGIIDQNTADKISAYQESIATEREAEMEKVKNMTKEERQAHFDSMKEARENNQGGERPDHFSDMVSAGVITQEQADAIQAAMPARSDKAADGEGKGKGFGRGPGMPDFSNLVTDGIIDQDTADKISAYQESLAAEREAEMEKVKNMTKEERQAHFDSIKEAREHNQGGERPDHFSDMVSAGVITQEQAEAIKAAMPTSTDKAGIVETR